MSGPWARRSSSVRRMPMPEPPGCAKRQSTKRRFDSWAADPSTVCVIVARADRYRSLAPKSRSESSWKSSSTKATGSSYRAETSYSNLFTEVPSRGVLRTSPVSDSAKVASTESPAEPQPSTDEAVVKRRRGRPNRRFPWLLQVVQVLQMSATYGTLAPLGATWTIGEGGFRYAAAR
jgi:hypothetical protein